MKRGVVIAAVVVALLAVVAVVALLVSAAMFFRAEQGPESMVHPSPQIPMQPMDAAVEPPRVDPIDAGARAEDKPPVVGPGLAPDRWLRGRLRGHDNNMAAMRAVTIREHDGRHVVHVANQFDFRCGLDLDEDGTPLRMTSCRGEEGWTATPDIIELECEIRARDELCRGDYMLGTTDGYRQRARFQLIRPLSREERAR